MARLHLPQGDREIPLEIFLFQNNGEELVPELRSLLYEGNMDVQNRNWRKSASEDLWERTLSQIITKFGQMAYLSRLRNPETDRYEHHGLTAVFGEAEAEEAVRKSHSEVLAAFLAMSILDQTSDVERYLEGLQQSARRLLANWDRSQGYDAVLPQDVSHAQKELFDGNMALIIRHLRAGIAGADERRS